VLVHVANASDAWRRRKSVWQTFAHHALIGPIETTEGWEDGGNVSFIPVSHRNGRIDSVINKASIITMRHNLFAICHILTKGEILHLMQLFHFSFFARFCIIRQ
jgi:hypothetical protein